MLIALLVVAALFAALALVRVGSARRAVLVKRWPALVLGALAALALARGVISLAVALALAAIWLWFWEPASPAAPQQNVDVAEARTLLGVGPNATAAEIRAAFRRKMREAHPDRGGSHAEAARLAAARDRLLKG